MTFVFPSFQKKETNSDYSVSRCFQFEKKKKTKKQLKTIVRVKIRIKILRLGTTDPVKTRDRMKFRGGGRDAYKGRTSTWKFLVSHRSLLECPRLIRGNTRNKFRNLTAIPPDASYENFRIFFGARDGKLSPLLPTFP